MLYTVKEVSSMSGATVKTLHHYHKVGLLMPNEISESGYRMYGNKELERLQQILVYKELDFTLEQIKQLVDEEQDRITVLLKQDELLQLRKIRLENIIETLRNTISCSKKGETMNEKEMFRGLASEDAWKEALKEQNEHLKQTYDFDMVNSAQINVQEMNAMAAEAVSFMGGMADALREGVKHNDEPIAGLLRSHLEFLNEHGNTITAADFAVQTQFFLGDDFHLRMLEDQQTGLAYYLCAAAESFAARG
ncbi:MerR family transcriptional regulator [Paenibacillus thalictri]|uniref:MerR family transcriptional regulator n=1 Tax=Paenibacillus thalictri TaxID=2527873 RepID=A0A4Q9DVI3_9BACL|nr:MerR family transcriptional regulator [Paenibacillus thalictri]TBL81054.1 MerR family transcriptional regulator [Paenibacillus thalictri]